MDPPYHYTVPASQLPSLLFPAPFSVPSVTSFARHYYMLSCLPSSTLLPTVSFFLPPLCLPFYFPSRSLSPPSGAMPEGGSSPLFSSSAVGNAGQSNWRRERRKDRNPWRRRRSLLCLLALLSLPSSLFLSSLLPFSRLLAVGELSAPFPPSNSGKGEPPAHMQRGGLTPRLSLPPPSSAKWCFLYLPGRRERRGSRDS